MAKTRWTHRNEEVCSTFLRLVIKPWMGVYDELRRDTFGPQVHL